MVYKCVNNLAPEYLCTKFKKRSFVHNRTNRNNNKLQIPLLKSSGGQRTFSYRAVSLWNELDEELKILTTVKSFKKFVESVYIFADVDFLIVKKQRSHSNELNSAIKFGFMFLNGHKKIFLMILLKIHNSTP